MHRYGTILALCGLALALPCHVHADTNAFEKSVQRSDLSNENSGVVAGRVPAWLVGTWVLIRCDNVYPDGRLVELYGSNPQGLWFIDAQGHYMMQMVRAEREPFATNDKSKGTPDEYRAASLGSNAHYGWVSVDGAQLRTHITHASYPSWDNRDGKTTFVLQGDLLTYSVDKPSSGSAEGARGVVVWRRVAI
ncbi:hypothetical protein DYGSA30_29880 [Dyella sp. GSA-30]|nr:hypothetical protein DYGSA30_29880 [Dyella sp. GSA-30]